MLKKSFVIVMFLAASLIGIGSAIHHQPEVATAQPQPQQPLQPPQSPQQQQQQLQSPNTAPPTLGKRLSQQDQALLDRLFPHIIRKLDGKMLAQKIDAATLVQKIDAKTLAAKVLPFLDIKVVAIERPGPKHNIDITGLREARATAKASCAPEESLIGGGFDVTGSDHAAPFYSHKESLFSSDTKRWVVPPDTKTWMATTYFESDGSITTYAECLNVELGLLSEPRPPPPPPPSQPPGGPPLQPPPGFGK